LCCRKSTHQHADFYADTYSDQNTNGGVYLDIYGHQHTNTDAHSDIYSHAVAGTVPHAAAGPDGRSDCRAKQHALEYSDGHRYGDTDA
jgi:hypothetical protein